MNFVILLMQYYNYENTEVLWTYFKQMNLLID